MKKPALLLFLTALALAGCASSPSDTGAQTGTSSTINGVEVWTGGVPSRPYTVLDKIQRVGADNSATYEEEEAFIADEARRRGADAIIVIDTVMAVSRMDLALSRPITAPKVNAELIKYR